MSLSFFLVGSRVCVAKVLECLLTVAFGFR